MGDFGDKKTSYACYPEWGKYGVRIEYRPPYKEKSAPQIMISEVMRDVNARDGYRFTTRPLNDKQRETGKYNPHASCAFDAIPAIIAALMAIRQDYAKNADGSVEGFPQAEAVVREYSDASDAIDLNQDLAGMGEFAAPGPGRAQKKAPAMTDEGDDSELPF